MTQKKTNPTREFHKKFEQNTSEALKEYEKAQKQYVKVLRNFIKQEIATKNDYEERYESSAVCCLENQWEADWAYLEDPNNQIKILFGMIGTHEFELLNPEEFEGEI